MRHYRITFHKSGRAGTFCVSGLVNALGPVKAFLHATNGTTPARSSIEALRPGEVVTFGLVPHGVLTIQRAN